MPSPTVEDAGSVARLVRADPVALFAAFFFLATCVLAFTLWRVMRSNAALVTRLYDDRARLCEDQTRLAVALLQGKRLPVPMRASPRPSKKALPTVPEEPGGQEEES